MYTALATTFVLTLLAATTSAMPLSFSLPHLPHLLGNHQHPNFTLPGSTVKFTTTAKVGSHTKTFTLTGIVPTGTGSKHTLSFPSLSLGTGFPSIASPTGTGLPVIKGTPTESFPTLIPPTFKPEAAVTSLVDGTFTISIPTLTSDWPFATGTGTGHHHHHHHTGTGTGFSNPTPTAFF